jgi:hypothetical protein
LGFSFYGVLILLGRVSIFSLDVSGGRVEVLFNTVGGLCRARVEAEFADHVAV